MFIDETKIKLNNPVEGVCTFTLGNNNLVKLDKLNLYLPPLNDNDRDGERFIFKSQILANKLTELLKNDMFKLDRAYTYEFVKVNEIFRYNKFLPDSNKFTMHHDIPYYDSKNHHASIYTLLIYLTPGSNTEYCFKSEDANYFVSKINKNDCIIFDQKYSHEGKPYIKGPKIFIRTELIFEIDDPEIDTEQRNNSQLVFNTACYMSLQSMVNDNSLFNKELKKYPSKCFEYATTNRYYKQACKNTCQYLLKKYKKNKQELSFITNGSYYYFDKYDNNKYIKNIAYLTLCDYFNASGNVQITFKTSKMIELDNYTKISELLQKTKNTFPTKFLGKFKYEKVELDEDKSEHCCDCHKSEFDSHQCPYVLEYVNSENKSTSAQINESGVYILGKKLYISEKDIFVMEDRITFSDELTISRINYAACWNGFYPIDAYTRPIFENQMQLSLPVIKYTLIDNMFQLNLDMFHNDLIFKQPTNINILEISDKPDISKQY